MAPKARRVPTRISRKWVLDNPELFRELCTPPDECPVCMQAMTHPRSPLLGDHPTSCRHFCCRDCWIGIAGRNPKQWRCPICREPLTDWLAQELGATVSVERFDRDMVRAYVYATSHMMGLRESDGLLSMMAATLLQQADSGDEEEGH